MLRTIVSPEASVRGLHRRRLRGPFASVALAATILGTSALIGFNLPAFEAFLVQSQSTGASPSDKISAVSFDARLLDAKPELGPEALKVWSNAPLPSSFRFASVQPAPIVQPATPPVVEEPVQAPAPVAETTIRTAQVPPLPVPRPAELSAKTSPAASRLASRQPSRRTRTAAAQAPAPDTRSFFEKLFDLPASAAPALSYAALDSRPLNVAPAPKLSPAPAPAGGAGVAVYDISARTLTLPSGERLEAHSGLRDKLDDPRYVHLRMRGATPPGTYDLTEREALFHGVRAIRLNPVGGSAAVHGRTGLLAHTYMLGPNGDSNGCVSLRDYDRFLQAYLRGEVRRLVVVAGNFQDGPPRPSNRRFGGTKMQAENARDG